MAESEARSDRGEELLVARGSQVRISDLSIDLDTGETGMTASLRWDMFDHWLRIAREERDRARAKHEAARTAVGDDEEFGAALEAEFRPSLVSISAAAFAIDAFFGSVVHQAPEARSEGRTRAKTVINTFVRAFEFDSEHIDAVRVAIPQLFGFRDEAVHPRASFSSPVHHPDFGPAMERRLVIFSASNATRASSLAHDVIRFCVHKPKAEWEDLVAWCEVAKTHLDAIPIEHE